MRNDLMNYQFRERYKTLICAVKRYKKRGYPALFAPFVYANDKKIVGPIHFLKENFADVKEYKKITSLIHQHKKVKLYFSAQSKLYFRRNKTGDFGFSNIKINELFEAECEVD